MRNLDKKYVDEHINETLGEFLSKFWDWLTGDDNTKSIYDPGDIAYDSAAKKKYINSYDDSKVKRFTTKDKQKILDIIEKAKPSDGTKSIFDKTKTYIENHVINELQYCVWGFTADDCKEAFAIQLFYTVDHTNSNAIDLPLLEYNPVYKKFINPASVKDSIDELCTECGKHMAIIKTKGYDKTLITKMRDDLRANISTEKTRQNTEDKEEKYVIYTK